jgi:hypothetical protein
MPPYHHSVSSDSLEGHGLYSWKRQNGTRKAVNFERRRWIDGTGCGSAEEGKRIKRTDPVEKSRHESRHAEEVIFPSESRASSLPSIGINTTKDQRLTAYLSASVT